MFSKLFLKTKKSGMTLLEIMIVIAILATFMTYLAQNLTSSQDAAMIDTAKIAMGKIEQALQMYRIHNYNYPTTQQGLDALVRNPGNAKAWRGPYIEESKLNDPWQNKFRYTLEGREFHIISNGPDGQEGTEDDIYYPEKEGANNNN